jgi:hypothetical protein
MLATRLVHVDGCLPGSGKSTTSQLLTLQLQKRGLAARWFFESIDPHILRMYQAIAPDDVGELAVLDNSLLQQEQMMDRDDFAQKSLQFWRAFVDSARQSEEIAVFDSCLLQHPLLFLLLKCQDVMPDGENVDEEWLVDYYVQVYDTLKELSPVLIYLYHDDTAKFLHKLCAERGAGWSQWLINFVTNVPYGRRRNCKGFQGAVTVLEFFRAVNANLFARLDMPKIAIDVSQGDWAAYHEQIADLLDLPLIPDEAGQNLAQFSGEYREQDSDLRCLVQIEAGQLTVNDLWEFPSRFVPLASKTAHSFLVMGLPVEITFEWLPAEQTWQMHIAASHTGQKATLKRG